MSFSCLFPHYFWVTSIPLSVGFFLCLSLLLVCPSLTPYALHSRRFSLFSISQGTSCDNLNLQWFLPPGFLLHLILHLFLQHDLSYQFREVSPLHNNQFIFGAFCLSSAGRHQMSNCGFMWFFMFVILSTNRWKALIVAKCQEGDCPAEL